MIAKENRIEFSPKSEGSVVSTPAFKQEEDILNIRCDKN